MLSLTHFNHPFVIFAILYIHHFILKKIVFEFPSFAINWNCFVSTMLNPKQIIYHWHLHPVHRKCWSVYRVGSSLAQLPYIYQNDRNVFVCMCLAYRPQTRQQCTSAEHTGRGFLFLNKINIDVFILDAVGGF